MDNAQRPRISGTYDCRPTLCVFDPVSVCVRERQTDRSKERQRQTDKYTETVTDSWSVWEGGGRLLSVLAYFNITGHKSCLRFCRKKTSHDKTRWPLSTHCTHFSCRQRFYSLLLGQYLSAVVGSLTRVQRQHTESKESI